MRDIPTSFRAFLLVAILFTTISAHAQGLSGLRGVISDRSGAVIPAVAVTITELETGAARATVTDESGTYTFTLLEPGDYTVRAEKAGFKIEVANDVTLPVDENISLDLRLEVGPVTEVVETLANVETVDTIDARLGVNFDSRRMLNLPLIDRNIVGLLGLEAGVNLKFDDGGQVNGARPDQQNMVLDGVNNNRQQAGSPQAGALPTTIDSVQEFVVQTGGIDATAGIGSGGQVQMITKGGTNVLHGSVYDFYRTTGTSATNYFMSERTPAVRHIPGASLGGPLMKDKLFLFGAYERLDDYSAVPTLRSVPTPQFLDGHIRYIRTDNSFGELTTGCASELEKWTGINCDNWNANLFGNNNLYERYRPYSTDARHTSPGSDGGANILNYRFNAPRTTLADTYIARLDYHLSSRHTFSYRGTLYGLKRSGLAPFPGIPNPSDNLNNSKGFAANWNWIISPRVNNHVTGGLTRESTETSGHNVSLWTPNVAAISYANTAASRQAIDTWSVSDNVSWIAGRHSFEGGFAFRYISNYSNSFEAVQLPTFTGPTDQTGNEIDIKSSPGLLRAVGAAEFNLIRSPQNVGDAVIAATGSVSQFSEDIQFDIQGNKLPSGLPFVRNFLLQEDELYLQDSWKLKANLFVVLGIHYGVQTPPYEKNGLQVNWSQDLQYRWRTQMDTTKSALQLPLYQAQPAGRVAGLRDYYPTDGNWAPRVSFAWAPEFGKKGGQTVIRGGYSMLYDGFGRSFAQNAASVGSIGLKTRFSVGNGSYSIDGLNNTPRAPRIGPNGWIGAGLNSVRAAFPPSPDQESFALPIPGGGGWGAVSTDGIDSNLHAARSHMFTLTVSKELPNAFVLETSYVGRFSRDLLGVTDISSPVNIRDPKSGTTWYDAVKQLYEQNEFRGVPVANIQPIPWFENAYSTFDSSFIAVAQRATGQTFNSVTQAFYYFLNQSLPVIGPNAQASLVDTVHRVEKLMGANILSQPQVQYFGLFSNLSRANYNSFQAVLRKRFSRGLATNLNYTLSKSLDYTSAAESRGDRPGPVNGEGLLMDPYHPEKQYARSDFDRRHQLNGTFQYELPFGRDRRFLASGSSLLNSLVSGWDLSGIGMVASGRPFSFTANSRYNFHYFGRMIPRLAHSIPFEVTKSTNNGTPDVYIVGTSGDDRNNIGSNDFVAVYPGGPIARNQGQGPSYFNLDSALTKNFTVREGIRGRFKIETFNVMNHPNFALPSNTDIDSTPNLLGRITGTNGTERTFQFSLRFEW
jgi:hypothetical protein